MRYVIPLAMSLLVAACAPTGAGPASATPSLGVGQPPPPSVPLSVGPHAYREVMVLGEFAQLSPDGTMVASIVGQNTAAPALVFQSLDGGVLGRWSDLMAARSATWLPDSSGVFVELTAPQRAGPLGIVEPDGHVTVTGLDNADPSLSPDGKWIAAERQEGCCVAIRIHEIWVAPRAGGPVRALVLSTDPAPQPLTLLGWSPGGDVLFRDGPHFRSATLGGAVTELVAPAAAHARMPVSSGGSPDRQVVLICSADPQQFWVIAKGTVADPPTGLAPAWPLRQPWCSQPSEVRWSGGHELLFKDAAGILRWFDAINLAQRTMTLPAGASIIAVSGDVLLVSIGGELDLISTSNGAIRPVGLRLSGPSAQPIAGGRFFIVNGRGGYLIG